MRTPALALLLTLALSAPAFAQCQFNLQYPGDHDVVTSGQPYEFHWSPIPGATFYRWRESVTGYRTPQLAILNATGTAYETNQTALYGQHFATDDVYYGYVLEALGADLMPICTTQFAVAIRPDAATRSFFRRIIVPVAGSLTTADGTRFHTSLRLTSTDAAQASTGRIIFHPQGQPASDADPSIDYKIEPAIPTLHERASVLYYDDVVAAVGVTGLGSIDIIPDGDIAPGVDARAWNDARGVFNGGAIPVFRAGDLLVPARFNVREITVWTDNGRARMNVGIRTAGPDNATVYVLYKGRLTFTLPANSSVQMSVDQLAGQHVPDGDIVQVIVAYPDDAPLRSANYVYYTTTENTSHDPRIEIPQVTADKVLQFTTVTR
jgi:hypothetical protein